MEIKKLLQSTVEIRGEIVTEIFESFREPALLALGREVTLPGFRPGHVPKEVLAREVGEYRVLERMAELALSDHYPKLLVENKLDALGRPSINITKLAKGNPLGFTITTAIHPEIKLPDYRTLAKEFKAKDSPSSEGESFSGEGEPLTSEIVTEEEISSVISDLEKSGKNEEILKLPDLREKILAGLKQEKATKTRDKRRLGLIEKIMGATTIDLPPILIESELETMMAEMKHEVGRMGLPFDQYLTHLKKTEVELKQNWRTQAEHRVKTGLILAEIARAEKLEAPKEELEPELKHLLEQHPKANPDRARAYLASLIVNEQVFKLLEK